ncbi:TSC22 domain family protein 4 isoform X1 [Cottoperca gobio]|uniref:TSC22 domain family protein 4-like isoform X1 n=1 Tax=Cottoperca gobio TaxID=56716 RepID=A0A6J2PCP6_COTGO|nr:TSC22 domain family protein 4-like isoform X1 [Cottoperca gobio]XP_029282913.1 TSC22 domain family protein 4-like isoform X1 [Cottoperca gobio]XP_029282914.1 TSC22 domain family protein 4-like isoform X1 [Cottoperca gobio]
MSGGKKRSGFQITSVTSDFNQTPAGQSAPSVVLTVLQSAASSSCSNQRSSSQPTTPSLKRKYVSHDAPGQGAGSSSRFRVVRLAVGGAGGGGRGEPYHRGRWTCTDILERQEGAGFWRVMDTMRHAHSLESLEMIGRDMDRGGVYSQDATHLLAQPIGGIEGAQLVLRSGPPSPTHQEPVNIRLLDRKEPMGAQCFDSIHPPPSPRPRNIPPPLRLDVDSAGRSVLRLSHSQPSSPPAGSYHPTLTPIQTPAAFSLDQTIFNLSGDSRQEGHQTITRDIRLNEGHQTITRDIRLNKGHQTITRDIRLNEGHQTITRDIRLNEGHQTITRDIRLNEGHQTITRDICLNEGHQTITRDTTP